MRFNQSSVQTAWQRIIRLSIGSEIEYQEQHYRLEERFMYHDIKSKGVSDHPENESEHKTESAKAVYMRKTKEVVATR